MLVLEAKQKPGPADYADAYNKPNLPKGGRISTDAKSKTWLEWVEYRAKETPGSCDYVAPRLKRRGGGRFSNAKPKTDTEWLIYHKSQLPGPGQYTPKAVFDPSNIKGGRFNESRPKTSIELHLYRIKSSLHFSQKPPTYSMNIVFHETFASAGGFMYGICCSETFTGRLL